MNKRNSIIKMIYSNIFIIIISFIVISLAINLLVYKQLYNRAIVNGETLSVGVAMHIKDRLQESQRDIYEIENLLDSGLLNNTEINLFLNTIMKKDPIIQAIEVISLDGTVIHGAPDKYMSEGMDRSGEPFFMRTKTDGSIYWSRIMTLMLTGKPSITISNIVNNQMVVLYLDITKISEMAIGYSRFLPESTRLIITDESGVYITNNDKSMINQRAVSPEFNSIMKSISNQSYYFKSLSEDALVNVSYIDNARWYVALYNPITYIMSPIRNTNLLLYLLLGIILTALYVYYRKSKSLASSIAQFSKQTKEISEGNYSLILDDQIFKELHDLGESFELMNNKIKERDTILSDYAYNDSLTGLPNRRSMMELLHANVSAKEPFHVIYFDLDQFKNLNDSFGHYNGDLVLKQVAIRILTCTKDSGLIGRIGGDEFLLIIENKKDENYINSLIDKIFSELQKPYDLASSQIYIGISAGISIYPNDSDNVSDLLKYSDIAMYSAKSAGRNRFKYFSIEMNKSFERKMQIENCLRDVVNRNELICYFQPQINLFTNEIVGIESLMRWQSSELGFVSPSEFIPYAEENNTICELTYWMFDEVCSSLFLLNERYDSKFHISINISIKDLKNPNFISHIVKSCSDKKVDPKNIVIEITESMMIDNYDEAILEIYEIRKLGFRFALDDFGKGYSSLSHLNNLPIDILKIDKDFLDSGMSTKGKQLIKSIIELSNKLGYTVIAEGIETEDQFEMLKEYDCFGGQGFLMSKPIPFDELIAFIDNKLEY